MSKDIRRREFLILAAAALAGGRTVAKTASAERVVDAGPASGYSNDGIYASFRDQGFFVIRKGKELLALSALCTHRKCKLSSEPDRSFYCNAKANKFRYSFLMTLTPPSSSIGMVNSSLRKSMAPAKKKA